MSLRASLWALDEAPTDDKSEVLVLLALADDADDTGGSCYPSLERIAARARMSVSGARRALQRLEAAGLVEVDRPDRQGRGQHNRYQLRLDLVRTEGSHDDTLSAEKKGVISAPKGRVSASKGAQRVAPGARIPVDPKPVDPRRRQISERRDYLDADATTAMLDDYGSTSPDESATRLRAIRGKAS